MASHSPRGRRHPARADGAVGLRPLLSRFDHPPREDRLIAQQRPLQVRTTRNIVVLTTVMAAVQWPITHLYGLPPIGSGDTVALVAAIAAGLMVAAGLATRAADRTNQLALWASIAVLPAISAVIVVAGAPIGAQNMLIVAGGPIIFYLSSRLDWLLSVIAAVGYSAVTIPAWLYWGLAASTSDTVYTLAIAASAHIGGAIEARRTHREMRAMFAQQEDLRAISAIDALTGLPNRRAFAERLAQVWESWRAGGRQPTVLMLDIDHFKRLNDTLGHPTGDVALRMVAEAIRNSLRKGSDHLVARYGGEEFVVLLPSEEHHIAHAIAERIGLSVRSAGIERAILPRTVTEPPIGPLTVSIGVAGARVTMGASRDLVDAADRALYEAKAAGRDCARCADDTDFERPAQRPAPSRRR